MCNKKPIRMIEMHKLSYEKDTYPNCDGEHDRWVSTTVGYTCIAFDMAAETVEESIIETLEY